MVRVDVALIRWDFCERGAPWVGNECGKFARILCFGGTTGSTSMENAALEFLFFLGRLSIEILSTLRTFRQGVETDG